MEGAREESEREIPSMLVLPPDVAGSSSALAAEEEIGPTLGGASGSIAPVE